MKRGCLNETKTQKGLLRSYGSCSRMRGVYGIDSRQLHLMLGRRTGRSAFERKEISQILNHV